VRVTIDQDMCIASGLCVIVAEGVFGQRDEDGVAVPLNPNPSDEHAEAVREAVELCPARAIAIAESDVAGERA
jgi:ferredoxin